MQRKTLGLELKICQSRHEMCGTHRRLGSKYFRMSGLHGDKRFNNAFSVTFFKILLFSFPQGSIQSAPNANYTRKMGLFDSNVAQVRKFDALDKLVFDRRSPLVEWEQAGTHARSDCQPHENCSNVCPTKRTSSAIRGLFSYHSQRQWRCWLARNGSGRWSSGSSISVMFIDLQLLVGQHFKISNY